ncbi:MAG: HAD-IIA family hydrolase [Clostridia bacterium]|nr:HAD-IIA family hydrolase [Clostridia bacterium]
MDQAQIKQAIGSTQCFLLDMDGTVYLSNHLIEGAREFILAARSSGRKVLFLTNNSSHTVEFYQNRLLGMGIETEPAEIMTSGIAAALMLRREHPGKHVWVLGNEELKAELKAWGIHVCEDEPQLVLAAFDNTLTYEKLCAACNYVRAGLPYIATHPDFNCPVPGGFVPDLGSFMALIEASTGRKADTVIGKPEKEIVMAAQSLTGLPLESMAMVGDRLYTDIATGKKHGLLSVLVLTGEAKREDIPLAQYAPDIVVDRLGDLTAFL